MFYKTVAGTSATQCKVPEGIFNLTVKVVLIYHRFTDYKTNLHFQTAVEYYDVASDYGVPKVKEVAFKWLLINLLSYYLEQPKYLRRIR
jgi:hypothetical protein